MKRFVVTIFIILIWFNVSSSCDYEYDLNGQLIRVVSGNGVNLEYNFDAMGNRTSMIITSLALATPSLQIAFQGEILTLHWNVIQGANSYRVQSSSYPGGPWSTIATITGTTLSTPSVPGVHLFRVIAVD